MSRTIVFIPRMPDGNTPGGLTVSKNVTLPSGDFQVVATSVPKTQKVSQESAEDEFDALIDNQADAGDPVF